MNDYVDRLWNSDAVACLDALKEADEAVETINRDMFSIIADVAADVAENEGRVDVLKDVLKEFEQKYKKERSLKHMPGSYRSAKSAIVNAVKHGIALGYEDGSLKGKSALEKEIKQATKKPKGDRLRQTDEDCTVVDEFVRRARASLAHTVPGNIGEPFDTGQLRRDLDQIKDFVERIEDVYL